MSTLQEVRERVQRRLGDTTATPAASRLWSFEEIDSYIKEGYEDLVLQGRLLWDMRYLDDLPGTGTHDFRWEESFMDAGERISRPSSFDAEWERDWALSPNAEGPCNHSSVAERDGYLITEHVPGVERLPEDLYAIDRVTWDDHKIDPARSRQLFRRDALYETVAGEVIAYVTDKDGLRYLRKWYRPSGAAPYYEVSGRFGVLRGSAEIGVQEVVHSLNMHIDEWGMVFSTGGVPALDAGLSIFWDASSGDPSSEVEGLIADDLVALQEFSGYEVIAPPDGFGILRKLPGYFPSNGPWGLVKRVSKGVRNTRVEYYRRPHLLHRPQDELELPRQYVKYVSHFALWKAYSRRGPGQDPRLAAHYKARYYSGVGRLIARRDRIHAARVFRMGGMGIDGVVARTRRPTSYGDLETE